MRYMLGHIEVQCTVACISHVKLIMFNSVNRAPIVCPLRTSSHAVVGTAAYLHYATKMPQLGGTRLGGMVIDSHFWGASCVNRGNYLLII